jgi:hypothetical protein
MYTSYKQEDCIKEGRKEGRKEGKQNKINI